MIQDSDLAARQKWRVFSRNMAMTAQMAESFLELSEEQRDEALARPGADRLRPYAGVQLAAAIREARALLHMLETAETAWKSVGRTGAP